jgi:replicative DNA helicase
MGVGKTTFTTIVANKAFERGHNVLQIIFEDNVTAIQRKHITIWTGISPSEFKDRKDEVKHLVERVNSNHKNKLLIQKLPSDGVNILQIGNIIKKIIADGVILDLVVLDYIDCVLPHRSSGNEWKDEASTMRKFEAMCSEFDIAGWVATQGSRDSISADVVTNDKVGGSVKKIAIAHVIITVAKTLYQKENKLATMAITKSRLGPDGIIFENCLYDNEMLKISTATNTTFLGHKENKEEAKANRVKELLAKANSTDDETYLG